MKMWTDTFGEGTKMREENTFLKPHPTQFAELSKNRNPHFAWGEIPPGTKSMALVMYDEDYPTSKDFANKKDKQVPYDYPRTEFYHWAIVDLDPKVFIQPAEFCKEVTLKGKPGPASARGTRSGLNDFTNWYKGNTIMEGNYYGYDGPAPPWNDEKIHRYVWTLYAIKEKRFPLEGDFTCKQVADAIKNGGLALEKAQMKCTYNLFAKAR